MKNAVKVRFLYRNQHLGQKEYVFKVFPKVAADLQPNQILFVKSEKGTPAPVVIQEVLSLPPREARTHKPVLGINKVRFYKPFHN